MLSESWTSSLISLGFRPEGEPVIFGDGEVRFRLIHRDLHMDQGVTVDVLGEIDGEQVRLLRFNCSDHYPHYLYGPDDHAEPMWIDRTTEGDPLAWAFRQIRQRLPSLMERAGYKYLADRTDVLALATVLDDVEARARSMEKEDRETVVHNRGEVVLEAGPVRFGVEYRVVPGIGNGVGIHVLGDVGDEEHELLAFDCFDQNAHYHYGPRLKNQRFYFDYTVTPDPLRWTLDLLRGGKLAPMLERAGYPDHAARLNPVTVTQAVEELEVVALRVRASHGQSLS